MNSPSHLRFFSRAFAFFAGFLLATAAPGAILVTETFEGGAAGWEDRDVGSGMTVSHQGSVGVPASGAMQGTFAAQGMFPIPETDAFMIDSGGNFLGSYAGLTGFTLDLYAEDVLPSDVAVRIWSGLDVFFYTLSLGSMAIDDWTTFTVPLTYSFGWEGGEAAFNSALANVTQVEVQLTRSGTGSQSYYLDNFGTTTQDFGDPGGESAIPEPSTLLLVAYFGGALALRRRWRNVA